MTTEEIAKKAAEIIFANEGNYGSVNKNDNGALSIGKVQWHGNRALNLMRRIISLNAQKAQECLQNVLYGEILGQATNWANRKASEAEAALLKTALTTTEGKKAQDEQAIEDVKGYCEHIIRLGVTDPDAIIFMADIENQGGAGASARIIKAGGKSLDELYASAKADKVFSKYMARRDAVLRKLRTKEVQMITIGHASIDEKGTIQGKTPGDQTTKEICIRTWWDKGWDVFLECLDEKLAEKAASFMEQICNDDNFGYSQPNRWKGYNAIVNNGGVKGAKGDFDCSSLILSCYILAGLNIAASGYTGNMKKILVATGKFKAHTDKAHVSSDQYAHRGDIFLKQSSHVVMALSDGARVTHRAQEGTSNEKANNSYTGKGIGTATAKTNMNVRKGAGTQYASIGGITKGASVEVLEELSNGWIKIVWQKAPEGFAYASNNSGKYFTIVKNGKAGNATLKPVGAKSFLKAVAGTYKTTTALNMRTTPGVLDPKNIITELPRGAVVQNYGYFTSVNGVRWLLVTYCGMVGYSSSEYLRK